MAKTINQKITITGGDEIARTLRDLARLGEQTFRQLAEAASKIDMKLPVDQVRQQIMQFGQAGQQAFGQLAQAAQSSISSINQVGTSSTQAAQGVAQVGTAARQTAQDVAAIGPAAQQGLGGVQQQASSASSAISGIGTAIRAVSITIGGLSATFSGLAIAAAAMGKNASDSVISIGRAADQAKLSIENFSRGSTVLQQFGLSAKEASDTLSILGSAGDRAFNAVVNSLQRAGVRVNRFTLENQEARTKFMQQAAAMADMVRNGRFLFDEATAAILKYAGAFNEVTGAARQPTEMLTELADRLARIPNSAERARAVTAIFGSELARVLVPALQRGTAEFVNMIGTIDRLRLRTTEAERKVGQDFRQAWDLLQAVIKRNNDELGILLAKPLTPFITRFAEAMRRSEATFKIYEAAIQGLLPLFDRFLQAVSGFGQVDAKFPEQLKRGVEEFGTAVATIFGTVIRPAFDGLIALATLAADTLSTLFGTEVTPTMVALGAVFAALLGPVKALGVALLALFGTAAGSESIDKFKESLKGLGIDLDAIRLKIEEVLKDIRLIIAGKEGEVKNRWLVDLKEAFIGLKNEVTPTVIAITGLIGFLLRTVGPANLARVAFLHLTGILTVAKDAALIFGGVLTGLARTLDIIKALTGATGFVPLAAAFAGLAIAIGIVITNIDKLIAAWEALKALTAGDLPRAEKAFELAGLKTVAEAVKELRRELEQNPNLSGWERAMAFLTGFLKGELAAIKRMWNETWTVELPFLHKLIVQPFIDAFKVIGAEFAIVILKMQEKWNEFKQSMQGTALGRLLPAVDTPEEIAARTEQIRQLGLEIERLSGALPQDRINAAFGALETNLGNTSRAAADAKTKTDDLARSTTRAADSFRQIRPGVFERVGTEAEQAANKVNSSFRRIRPGVFERITTDARQATQQVAQTAEQLVSPFKQAQAEINAIVEQIKAKFAEIGNLGAAGATAGTEQPGGGLFAGLVVSLRQAQTEINTIIDEIKAKLAEIGSGGGIAPATEGEEQPAATTGGLFSGLIAGFQQALAQLQQMVAAADPFQPLVQQAQNAINFIIQIFGQLAQATMAPFQSMQAFADAAMAAVTQVVSTGFQSMVSVIQSVAQQIDAIVQQIIGQLQAAVAEAERLAAAAQAAANAASSAGGGSGGGNFFGGYTGDGGIHRVAGVVHGGEYVEPARVVRQPGVRAFLETLRRVGDLRKAIRYFMNGPGFSVGGYVNGLAGRMSGALMPGYAGGGLVTATSKPRNLGVLRLAAGHETFEVMADENTAFKLQRFARRQLMTSGGRAPVWER